jgi:hypothetical protein
MIVIPLGPPHFHKIDYGIHHGDVWRNGSVVKSSVLEEDEWSASHPGRSTPGERAPLWRLGWPQTWSGHWRRDRTLVPAGIRNPAFVLMPKICLNTILYYNLFKACFFLFFFSNCLGTSLETKFLEQDWSRLLYHSEHNLPLRRRTIWTLSWSNNKFGTTENIYVTSGIGFYGN